MEHKIKSQIAFFYSERSGQYTSALKDLEATAEKFAGQIIMLYVDIDDPSNKPVSDTKSRDGHNGIDGIVDRSLIRWPSSWLPNAPSVPTVRVCLSFRRCSDASVWVRR